MSGAHFLLSADAKKSADGDHRAMCATASTSSAPIDRAARAGRLYWLATGLFCAIFVLSALSYFVDYDGAAATYERLGYPDRLVWPLAAAKLLGVAAILWGRSRTLTLFAFAGFLFDLLLALQAHIAEREADVVLLVMGLALWAFAFWAHRRRYGHTALA